MLLLLLLLVSSRFVIMNTIPALLFLFCFVYFCLFVFVFSSVKCNSRAINLTFLALAFVYLLRLRFFVLFVGWFDRTCGFCCFSVSFVWFLAKIIVPTGCFGCQLFSFVCVVCFRFSFLC